MIGWRRLFAEFTTDEMRADAVYPRGDLLSRRRIVGITEEASRRLEGPGPGPGPEPEDFDSCPVRVEVNHLALGRREATNRALFELGQAERALKSAQERITRASDRLAIAVREERRG